MRGRRRASAPSSVRRTTTARWAASRARSENQPRSGATTRIGQQAVVQGRLGNDEQRRTGQAVRGEHLLKVRRDVVLGALRHPVEQHRQRGAALLGGLQHVPRHGVGVAGCDGDVASRSVRWYGSAREARAVHAHRACCRRSEATLLGAAWLTPVARRHDLGHHLCGWLTDG